MRLPPIPHWPAPGLLLLWLSTVASADPLTYAAITTAPAHDSDDSVEVVHVFWAGCPDCGQLEERLPALMQRLPERVVFERMPAISPLWEPHARAFFAADALGQLECFHRALNESMQKEGQQPASEDELVAFAGRAGIDAEAFRDAYRSDATTERMRKAASLTERYEIDAVPTLIIDGRYKTSLRLAGDHQTMIDTAEALVRERLAADETDGNRRRR
jgi:thiol:disulfide interchange protein DsbA